uniref:Predicted protein n=1 Tax=Hordeum vulgare subsp. vulgare TaxID=112509 RepID=F2EJ44_HORVV|nr:predicted protein [Hordeum vulgare subsp. vulgare]
MAADPVSMLRLVLGRRHVQAGSWLRRVVGEVRGCGCGSCGRVGHDLYLSALVGAREGHCRLVVVLGCRLMEQGGSVRCSMRGAGSDLVSAGPSSRRKAGGSAQQWRARWVGHMRGPMKGVESGGNAARAGLKSGDQVLYTSSFFGDELWPADKLGFTKTAIQAKPDSVYFVVSRGGGDIDVKRLPKRPAPPRFGRKLSDSQKARATHICLDCGYIYFLPKPFEEQPGEYGCPQCNAPKKRFARYNVESGKPIGGALPPLTVIVSLVIGIAGIGALLVYGLQ